MKLPGMTSHFLKKNFKGASDSWQFLDHYMRSWNCQELLSLNGTRIGFLLQCYQMWKHFLAISWSQYVFMELPGTTYIFKKCKNNQIFVMEMTGITFTLKANPGNSFITMKSPGITLSFHKIFFWNNASYSWQFLDHYMWIRNCQDCMYNPKVSAPTHLKPLRQALYFLTLPWVIRGKTQLG